MKKYTLTALLFCSAISTAFAAERPAYITQKPPPLVTFFHSDIQFAALEKLAYNATSLDEALAVAGAL